MNTYLDTFKKQFNMDKSPKKKTVLYDGEFIDLTSELSPKSADIAGDVPIRNTKPTEPSLKEKIGEDLLISNPRQLSMAYATTSKDQLNEHLQIVNPSKSIKIDETLLKKPNKTLNVFDDVVIIENPALPSSSKTIPPSTVQRAKIAAQTVQRKCKLPNADYLLVLKDKLFPQKKKTLQTINKVINKNIQKDNNPIKKRKFILPATIKSSNSSQNVTLTSSEKTATPVLDEVENSIVPFVIQKGADQTPNSPEQEEAGDYDVVENDIVLFASSAEVRNKKFPLNHSEENISDEVIIIADQAEPTTNKLVRVTPWLGAKYQENALTPSGSKQAFTKVTFTSKSGTKPSPIGTVRKPVSTPQTVTTPQILNKIVSTPVIGQTPVSTTHNVSKPLQTKIYKSAIAESTTPQTGPNAPPPLVKLPTLPSISAKPISQTITKAVPKTQPPHKPVFAIVKNNTTSELQMVELTPVDKPTATSASKPITINVTSTATKPADVIASTSNPVSTNVASTTTKPVFTIQPLRKRISKSIPFTGGSARTTPHVHKKKVATSRSESQGIFKSSIFRTGQVRTPNSTPQIVAETSIKPVSLQPNIVTCTSSAVTTPALVVQIDSKPTIRIPVTTTKVTNPFAKAAVATSQINKPVSILKSATPVLNTQINKPVVVPNSSTSGTQIPAFRSRVNLQSALQTVGRNISREESIQKQFATLTAIQKSMQLQTTDGGRLVSIPEKVLSTQAGFKYSPQIVKTQVSASTSKQSTPQVVENSQNEQFSAVQFVNNLLSASQTSAFSRQGAITTQTITSSVTSLTQNVSAPGATTSDISPNMLTNLLQSPRRIVYEKTKTQSTETSNPNLVVRNIMNPKVMSDVSKEKAADSAKKSRRRNLVHREKVIVLDPYTEDVSQNIDEVENQDTEEPSGLSQIIIQNVYTAPEGDQYAQEFTETEVTQLIDYPSEDSIVQNQPKPQDKPPNISYQILETNRGGNTPALPMNLTELAETLSAVANITPGENELTNKTHDVVYLIYPISSDPNNAKQGQLSQVIALVPSDSTLARSVIKHPKLDEPKNDDLIPLPKFMDKSRRKSLSPPPLVTKDGELYMPTNPFDETDTEKGVSEESEPPILEMEASVELESPEKIESLFTPVDIRKIINKGKKRVIHSRCKHYLGERASIFCRGFTKRARKQSSCVKHLQNIIKEEDDLIAGMKKQVADLYESNTIYCGTASNYYLPETVIKEEVDDDVIVLEDDEPEEELETISQVVSRVNKEVLEIAKGQKEQSHTSRTEEALRLIKKGLKMIQHYSEHPAEIKIENLGRKIVETPEKPRRKRLDPIFSGRRDDMVSVSLIDPDDDEPERPKRKRRRRRKEQSAEKPQRRRRVNKEEVEVKPQETPQTEAPVVKKKRRGRRTKEEMRLAEEEAKRVIAEENKEVRGSFNNVWRPMAMNPPKKRTRRKKGANADTGGEDDLLVVKRVDILNAKDGSKVVRRRRKLP